MTIAPERPTLDTATPESARVAELQQMIQSGQYTGHLDELKDELAKAKAARSEVRDLTAAATLGA